jgi:hypothetical protein
MRRDGTTPQNATRYGPETVLADTGPAATELLRGNVQHNSPQTLATRKVLTDRQEGRAGRLQADVDQGLGPAKATPREMKEALKAERQAVTPDLQAVFRTAPPVTSVKGIATVIDARMKTAEGPQLEALKKIRKALIKTPAVPAKKGGREKIILPNGKFLWRDKPDIPAQPEVLKTNLENLHNIKVMIDNMIDFGDDTIKPGALAQKEGAAKFVRGLLSKEMKRTDPRYEIEMNRSRDIAKRTEGLQIGRDALKLGDEPVRPDDLQADLDANNGVARDTIRAGNRHYIEDRIGTNEELGVLKKMMGGDFSFNRAKLDQIQGVPFRQRMDRAIDREEVFTRTNQAAQGGSQTARNVFTALQFASDVAPNRLIRAVDIPARVIEWVIEKVAGLRGEKLRDEIARVSGLQGPALEKLVREIQRREAVTGRVNETIQKSIPGLLAADGVTHTAREMERR